MDYEKKYKEALERAKEELEKDLHESGAHAIKNIFPELKPNEDECIKEELKSFITLNGNRYNQDVKANWINWLDKQVNTSNDSQQENKIQLGKTYKCIASPRYSAFTVGRIYKPEDDFLCRLMNLCSDCFEEIAYYNILFRVGSWITDGVKVGQVLKWKSFDSIVYRNINGEEKSITKEEVSNWREWTINDAKPGDVLVYKGEVFMFKDLKATRTIEYYLCYDGKNLINNSIYSLIPADLADIHPPTKEQREMLFKKMHESGYEWDGDKKELKKIIPYVEQDGDETIISNLIYALENDSMKPSDRDEYIEWLKEKLNNIKKQNWQDKENDVVIESIITNIKQIRDSYPNDSAQQIISNDQIEWLKQLKERNIK